MLYYVNIGLGLLILLNFKTCVTYLAKSYILGEMYVNDFLYKNKRNLSYYTLDNFTESTFSETSEKPMIAKIEFEDKIRYMVSDKAIETNEIEALIAITSHTKFFLSVELTYDNNTIDLTSEINMLINDKCFEFNIQTANLLMFIKDNANQTDITGPIMWGIITNNANMYNSDNIILNIKENNLVLHKD